MAVPDMEVGRFRNSDQPKKPVIPDEINKGLSPGPQTKRKNVPYGKLKV